MISEINWVAVISPLMSNPLLSPLNRSIRSFAVLSRMSIHKNTWPSNFLFDLINSTIKNMMNPLIEA